MNLELDYTVEWVTRGWTVHLIRVNIFDDSIGDGTVMGTKIGVGGSFPALNLDAGRLAARAFLGGISQAIAVRNVVNPLFLIVALTDFIQLRYDIDSLRQAWRLCRFRRGSSNARALTACRVGLSSAV